MDALCLHIMYCSSRIACVYNSVNTFRFLVMISYAVESGGARGKLFPLALGRELPFPEKHPLACGPSQPFSTLRYTWKVGAGNAC